MQIDWFTVAAEIINFLILIALLKRFLYDRIIDVAEAREQKIGDRFAEAEEHKETAENEAKSYRRQQQELEEKRDKLLAEAREEANKRRNELMEEARTAVNQKEHEWHEAISRERERFLRRLNRQASEQLYAVARRALADLADAGLEQQVVAVFLDRLRQLDDEEREAIRSALGDDGAEVRTAFSLPESSRQEVVNVLQAQLSDKLSPQFSVDEDLVCGVALRVNGRQVTWNIASYLDHLEQQVQETLEEAHG